MDKSDLKEIQTYLYEMSADQKLILREIDLLSDQQQEQTRKIDNFQAILYDPENGLYTQLRRNRSDISQLRIQLSNIGGGEDLSDLRSAIESNKLVVKILTIASAAAITGIVSMCLAVFL